MMNVFVTVSGLCYSVICLETKTNEVMEEYLTVQGPNLMSLRVAELLTTGSDLIHRFKSFFNL